MEMFPLVPSSRVLETSYFSTLVGERQAALLIQRAGLARADASPPPTLDMVAFWRLCAENIQACNDESHGIADDPVPRGSLSVLVSAVKEADDLGEALERLAAAARLIRKECQVSLSKGSDGVRLTIRPTRPSLRAEVYAECFIIVIHCALRWMTERRLDPLSVRGAAKLKSMGGALLLAFHAPMVRRGQGVTLLYRRDDMDAPILGKKYKAWGEAEFASFMSLLDQDEAPGPRVCREELAVVQALKAGFRTQDDVAHALHLSTATLRRKLAEAGLNFRRISAEVRRVELCNLLATEMSLSDIAERLGLSDDRSLRRFCFERLGMSPRQYRRLRL